MFLQALGCRDIIAADALSSDRQYYHSSPGTGMVPLDGTCTVDIPGIAGCWPLSTVAMFEVVEAPELLAFAVEGGHWAVLGYKLAAAWADGLAFEAQHRHANPESCSLTFTPPDRKSASSSAAHH
ncbi:hypothetical protein MKZ38_005760 [Zalerion maritima]|uniref:Uncharacterized protein n=1 Tax=Zalerion maritima TaxID=339359 RepID=A0AAD5RJR5_9PEZI|nr:hypothetical protein MKZ38_005760 [Zalerion maritima]